MKRENERERVPEPNRSRSEGAERAEPFERLPFQRLTPLVAHCKLFVPGVVSVRAQAAFRLTDEDHIEPFVEMQA